jgi:hypothetical protein
MPFTAAQVAAWMLKELEASDCLYQNVAADQIALLFGYEFTYDNARGNRAISKEVLAEFKKLTGNTVVWQRRERVWRKRQSYDEPGRRQY